MQRRLCAYYGMVSLGGGWEGGREGEYGGRCDVDMCVALTISSSVARV